MYTVMNIRDKKKLTARPCFRCVLHVYEMVIPWVENKLR